jgi:hypothetical protein
MDCVTATGFLLWTFRLLNQAAIRAEDRNSLAKIFLNGLIKQCFWYGEFRKSMSWEQLARPAVDGMFTGWLFQMRISRQEHRIT